MNLGCARQLALAASVCALALLVASPAPFSAPQTGAVDRKAVLETYGNIAEAVYGDSVIAARALDKAVSALLAAPSDATLAAARQSWRDARVPYMQTEVYRFGNKIVDDWEGKVNAWPLDEGLIDYVAGGYGDDNPDNAFYAANVIGHKSLKVSGRTIDTSRIDENLLIRFLHEAGGVEANVAIGFHAVEFLLWGQDLNGTGPGAGNRTATDFDLKACTGGNCDRRAAYLKTVSGLLIKHLEWMHGQWGKNGAARRAVIGKDGLKAVFIGLGSLTYGELAGERMKLGLMIHDPEEEHDCFSDNTHASHYYDQIGVRNIWLGSYKRIDGTTVSGSSLSALVKAASPEADAAVSSAIDGAEAKLKAIVARAEAGEAYDQMIGEDNPEGNAVVQAAVDALLVQARALRGATSALALEDIAFQGSDSLDDPSKVETGTP